MSDALKPVNSVTISRPDLEITLALDQSTLEHGTSPRKDAKPIGLKIKFSPDDYSWLNEEEMKLLSKLITTGIVNGFK